MPTLTLPKPHPAQQQVIDRSKRFNVLCCGRRWGKTELGMDRLIHPALAGKISWAVFKFIGFYPLPTGRVCSFHRRAP
jgi:hypothetical protein